MPRPEQDWEGVLFGVQQNSEGLHATARRSLLQCDCCVLFQYFTNIFTCQAGRMPPASPGRQSIPVGTHYLRCIYVVHTAVQNYCTLQPLAASTQVTIQSLRPKPIADHEPMFMTQFLTTARDTKANGYEPRKKAIRLADVCQTQTAATANTAKVSLSASALLCKSVVTLFIFLIIFLILFCFLLLFPLAIVYLSLSIAQSVPMFTFPFQSSLPLSFVLIFSLPYLILISFLSFCCFFICHSLFLHLPSLLSAVLPPDAGLHDAASSDGSKTIVSAATSFKLVTK